MKNQKAIVFDIDGTILDMKELILRAYSDTFAIHKLGNITWKKLTPLMGNPLEECYRILTKKKDVKIFCQTHWDFQKKNLNLAKPFLNTKKTLKTLKEKNIKMAAFTSRSKRTSIDTLRNADILKYFDCVISREDVLFPKPNPEGLIKALKEMKVPQKNSYMVGDALVDIQVGKQMKIPTVGAAYGFLGKDILKYRPDYIIEDISEIIKVVNANQMD